MSWNTDPLHKALLASEAAQLQQWLPSLFGYHLLFLGDPALLPLTNSSLIGHRVSLAPTMSAGAHQQHVRAIGEQLPFKCRSLDVVIVHHLLEQTANPHTLFSEIHRVLRAEGVVIIQGMRPYSWLRVQTLFRKQNNLNIQHWHSPRQLLNRLNAIGFVTLNCQSHFFQWPAHSSSGLAYGVWMERLGSYAWPFMGSLYTMVLLKREATFTSVMPSWGLKSPVWADSSEITAPRCRSHSIRKTG